MQDRKTPKGIIFSDLDGTLLDDYKGEISPNSLKARWKLKKRGFIFTLSTGRDMDTHYSVKYIKILKPDAIIHNNGAKITVEGKLLFKHYMDAKLLQRIYEFCRDNGLCIGTSVGNDDFFMHPEVKVKAELLYKAVMERNFIPFEEIFTRKLKVITLSYAGDVEREKPVLEKAFPEIELFPFAGGAGADVVERGFSKARGMERICQYYGVELKDTYALGDSANDVPMLKLAGVSIAMGNADTVAKESASYITDRVEKDGFYKAIKHFKLI